MDRSNDQSPPSGSLPKNYRKYREKQERLVPSNDANETAEVVATQNTTALCQDDRNDQQETEDNQQNDNTAFYEDDEEPGPSTRSNRRRSSRSRSPEPGPSRGRGSNSSRAGPPKRKKKKKKSAPKPSKPGRPKYTVHLRRPKNALTAHQYAEQAEREERERFLEPVRKQEAARRRQLLRDYYGYLIHVRVIAWGKMKAQEKLDREKARRRRQNARLGLGQSSDDSYTTAESGDEESEDTSRAQSRDTSAAPKSANKRILKPIAKPPVVKSKSESHLNPGPPVAKKMPKPGRISADADFKGSSSITPIMRTEEEGNPDSEALGTQEENQKLTNKSPSNSTTQDSQESGSSNSKPKPSEEKKQPTAGSSRQANSKYSSSTNNASSNSSYSASSRGATSSPRSTTTSSRATPNSTARNTGSGNRTPTSQPRLKSAISPRRRWKNAVKKVKWSEDV